MVGNTNENGWRSVSNGRVTGISINADHGTTVTSATNGHENQKNLGTNGLRVLGSPVAIAAPQIRGAEDDSEPLEVSVLFLQRMRESGRWQTTLKLHCLSARNQKTRATPNQAKGKAKDEVETTEAVHAKEEPADIEYQ